MANADKSVPKWLKESTLAAFDSEVPVEETTTPSVLPAVPPPPKKELITIHIPEIPKAHVRLIARRPPRFR